MAIWVLSQYDGPELDYPTLGFRADTGSLLSATAAPDARWSLNGNQAAAETVTRYTVGGDPSYVEPTDGHVLTWSNAGNAYVPTSPDGTVEALIKNTGGVGPLTSAALSNTIAAEAEPLTVSGKRAVRKDKQVIDVRDWGVIGDGASRPLSTLYGSLGAAQVDYPQALALADELDWAATQKASSANPGASLLVHKSLRLITNRPIDVKDGQTWTVDGVIENNWPRNSPSTYQDRANVFRLGNIHPIIVKAGTGFTWPTHALNAVAVGARIVTVTTPGVVTGLAVGDKVIIRNNDNPETAGQGETYDYEQINKVVAWDSGTGALTLERPIKVAIPTDAKLLVNSGALDTSNGQPWWFADNVKIKGAGKLIGNSPLGFKMGAWKCDVDIEVDCQDALSAQACVDSTFKIRGQFTCRLLEVKMVAADSRFDVSGTFKPDATITPTTTVAIGEQANGCDVTIDLHRGPEHTTTVRALEVYAQDIKVRGRIFDFSAGANTEVVAVKSGRNLGRPPSDIDLDLYIRTTTGKTQYMTIGNDANLDSIANDADPTRVKWKLNARTVSGAVPSYAVQTLRGSDFEQVAIAGDVRRANPISPGEVPERAPILLTTISGAPTYATGDTVVGTLNMAGVKSGDQVHVSLQQITAPTLGTFSDLYATAAVFGAGSVRVYIRNRSATSVVFPAGTAMWVYATWERRRV